MEKLTRWLYAIAIVVFSALLVAFAHDIEQGVPIGIPSTNSGKQAMLMTLAEVLGLNGSLVLGVLASGTSLYHAIKQHFTESK